MGPYRRWADREWPDRTTTDHRDMGYAAKEDTSVMWILVAILVVIVLLAL